MTWSAEEIDELLIRYLDRELSSEELKRFEQLLLTDSTLRQKLTEWKALREGLKELCAPTAKQRGLGEGFADRVIEAAQARVREQTEPGLAPWVLGSASELTVDSASRLQRRNAGPGTNREGTDSRGALKRFWIRCSVLAIAASLVAIAIWNRTDSRLNTLLIDQSESLSQGDKSNQESASDRIEIQDSNVVINKVVPLFEPPAGHVASNNASSPFPTTSVPPKQSTSDATSSNPLKSNPDPAPSFKGFEKDKVSPLASSELIPSAEQMKLLERMTANPNGMFLFVIDVDLPENVTELDALKSVLDRHDIAWASELEISEAIQANLVKSRMISEAGKQGLIPDFVDPNLKKSQPETGDSTRQVVSLVFVKARGSRLDAALIEVMRRTEDFPAFSFDLAFDPPTHALLEELQFIQEASLPRVKGLPSQNVSHTIRRAGNPTGKASITDFLAGPRRTKTMELETRRQSKLPVDSETMNPISYALFIVRHAERDSTR